MHDGMQYDPIQGQGHELLKVGNSAIFKGYLLPHLDWALILAILLGLAVFRVPLCLWCTWCYM